MASFDIDISWSVDLDNSVGDTAAIKAKEYIETAINNYSNHSVTVTLLDTISLPQEIVLQSFTTNDHPCLGTTPDSYYWEDLGEWWEEATYCKADYTKDSNLLLTNYDSQAGVCWNNRASVAEGGQHIADLPSYERYGSDDGGPFDSMQTAFHELGHALMDIANEHNVGYDMYYAERDGSDFIGKSPMGYTESTNECGRNVGSASYGDWAMEYSDCANNSMG